MLAEEMADFLCLVIFVVSRVKEASSISTMVFVCLCELHGQRYPVALPTLCVYRH